MLLVFLVLSWSLFLFRKYFLAMLIHFCCVHSLWKYQLNNLFHSGDTFQCILCMLMKENLWILSLWYVVLYLSLILFVHLLLMFLKDLKSFELLPVFVIVLWRKLSCLFSFSYSIVYCIYGSWLLKMSKTVMIIL